MPTYARFAFVSAPGGSEEILDLAHELQGLPEVSDLTRLLEPERRGSGLKPELDESHRARAPPIRRLNRLLHSRIINCLARRP